MERIQASRLVVALLLLTVRCAASPAARETAEPAVPLENSVWSLVDIRGRAVTAPPGRAATLQLVSEGDSHKAVGNGGCNRFGGTYTLEGSVLRFGPLASTKMFCEGVMEQEQAFLDALSATTGYRIESNDLLLLGPDGPSARLRAGSEK